MEKEVIHIREIDLIDLLTGDKDVWWRQTHEMETVIIKEASGEQAIVRRLPSLIEWAQSKLVEMMNDEA